MAFDFMKSIPNDGDFVIYFVIHGDGKRNNIYPVRIEFDNDE